MSNPRFRTRTTMQNQTGYHINKVVGTTDYSDSISKFETARDTSGRVYHYPLTFTKFTSSGGRISGSNSSHEFQDFPCDWLTSITKDDIITTKGRPPDQILLSKLLVKTNPSSQDFDFARSMLELREFPAMIRDTGNLFRRLNLKQIQSLFKTPAKDAGRNFLLWKFGWKPLIKDLNTVLDFHDSVAKRRNRLTNLGHRGSETLKRTLWKHYDTEITHATLHSNGAVLQPEMAIAYAGRVSGYVTWVLDDPSSFPATDEDLSAMARNLAMGMTPGSDTAWNLIPWTWLVDWFTNFSDYMSLTRNLIPAHPDTVRLMDHSTKVIQTVSTNDGDINLSPMRVAWETKSRWDPGSLSSYPSWHLPALTGGQVSIIAALLGAKRHGSLYGRK